MTLVQHPSLRLRRSRRLSSTRGLVPKLFDSSFEEEKNNFDLNQKLGLCPIVSVRNNSEKKVKKISINDDRGLVSKDWDYNEKISLSSGSSTKIDLRAGFELTGKLDPSKFFNVNADEKKKTKKIEIKNSSRWYLEEEEGMQIRDENVIKSDSKYEIEKPKKKIEKIIFQKSKSKLDEEEEIFCKDNLRTATREDKIGSHSRSKASNSKKKIDKSSDSISKRLELIHELNQRVLENYEKFQQNRSRSKSTAHTKNGNKFIDSKETLRSLKKEIFIDKDKLKDPDGKNLGNKILKFRNEKIERNDSDGKRLKKNKEDPVSYSSRGISTNKFTFSKDYCERLVGSSKIEKLRDHSCRSKTKKNQNGTKNSFNHDVVNENFSMQTYRKNFYADNRELSYAEISNRAGGKEFIKGNCESTRENQSKFYLEEEEGEEEEEKRNEVEEFEGIRKAKNCNKEIEFENNCSDENFLLISKKDSEISNSGCKKVFENLEKYPKSEDAQATTILEKRILADLNRTIKKFEDESMTGPETLETSKVKSLIEKNESFSSDSIQSSSDNSQLSQTSIKLQENMTKKKNKENFEGEIFNSSWDSGVGVELGGGSGWVRVHTGIESSLVYLTLDTTAKDVCRDMLLGDDLSLFVQYGGEPGRRLGPYEKPLELQDAFLQRLGYLDSSRRARLGVDPELRHLVAFHVGPSAPVVELDGYSQSGYVLVLKGLVFPQWKRRPLAVIGSRLFLYPGSSEASPEWIELGGNGSAVCCAPSRLGKLVLRVTGYPKITSTSQSNCSPSETSPHHTETRHLYLGFHHPWDRDLWRGWLKQATQHTSCPRLLDLSKGGLSRIPDSTIAFPAIEELLLGQNQLGNPKSNLEILQRFPRLTSLHLQRNNLKNLPIEILELEGLTILDISDNLITEIPKEIKHLVNLEELTLDRNGLKDLPLEVGDLKHLRIISVVGNLLEALPHFLKMRALVVTDVQGRAGDQSKFFKDEKNNRNNLHKVNLRNNQLKGSIILGNYGNLTHLDVSENNIETLDVSALQGLRSVRCARNILTELTLCGRNLISLIAGNNRLKKLRVEPIPTNLEHLDVSYNSLESLPDWTPELPLLRALFASNNSLTALPDRLLSQSSRLEVLHLPHNRLQALPPPRRPLNLAHLTLQGNTLTALPENFFVNTSRLKVLNLSNNRLTELPNFQDSVKTGQSSHSLEKFYVTGNCLTDTALDSLARFPALRVLHAAYNSLDTMPESCIASWTDLEELVLSGNRLQYLPDNVANLQHLRVLRVHSNRLLTCPTFNKMNSLRVLDLAHNQLDRINLESLVPPQLQFLDISCNSRLHVDPRQFQVYRSQRPLSLVDVSGQNRSSLPSHPHHQEMVTSERSIEQPWRLGFSETAGGREKLFVSQIRMPSFCNVEGLFGVFDGGSNQEAPVCLQEMIPRLLLEERTIKETSREYLKYTLLSAHRELKEKGQKYGVDATLVHLTRLPSTPGYPRTSRRYSLKIATSGEARAVLCRAAGPLTLAPGKKNSVKNQLGNAAMFPLVVPDPVTEEVLLEDDDEFLIIANRRLWEVLNIQEAVREARAEASPVLAAKRLQDLAQAYGAEDNLSVIVLRLNGPGSPDIDQLMRELRHAVGKSRGQNEGNGCFCPCCQPPSHHKSPKPCCCHVNNGYYLNGVVKNIVNSRPSKPQDCTSQRLNNNSHPSRASESDITPSNNDDRSSPSGQSDQTSDSTFKSRHPSGRQSWTNASRTRKDIQTVKKPNGTGFQEADDALSDKSGGALSEEQFRCWEYMLEQNTQLLFDKELDTLTRSPLRRGQSRSTPHLTGNLPFLSKRFGSARTFSPGIPRAPVRFGSGRRFLSGGPNAAYFGSLQRLMPYNLEYDFAVIQERAGLDSLEQDTSRMQQYWGVATTEL